MIGGTFLFFLLVLTCLLAGLFCVVCSATVITVPGNQTKFIGQETIFQFSVATHLVHEFLCYVNGNPHTNAVQDTDGSVETLDCNVTTTDENQAIKACALPDEGDLVCSETVWLNVIHTPPPVFDLVYELEPRGVTFQWKSDFPNVTGYSLAFTVNGVTVALNTTKLHHSHPVLNWSVVLNISVTVQAFNPSGTSDGVSQSIEFGQDISVVKHAVVMTAHDAYLEVNTEPRVLSRPTFIGLSSNCAVLGRGHEETVLLNSSSSIENMSLEMLRLHQNKRNCFMGIETHPFGNVEIVHFNTYDVQIANLTTTADGLTRAECKFAVNSQAKGCCFEIDKHRDKTVFRIDRNKSSNSGFLLLDLKLSRGQYNVNFYDLEKGESQCSPNKSRISMVVNFISNHDEELLVWPYVVGCMLVILAVLATVLLMFVLCRLSKRGELNIQNQVESGSTLNDRCRDEGRDTHVGLNTTHNSSAPSTQDTLQPTANETDGQPANYPLNAQTENRIVAQGTDLYANKHTSIASKDNSGLHERRVSRDDATRKEDTRIPETPEHVAQDTSVYSACSTTELLPTADSVMIVPTPPRRRSLYEVFDVKTGHGDDPKKCSTISRQASTDPAKAISLPSTGHQSVTYQKVDDCASSDDDEDCDGYTAQEVDQATSSVADHGQSCDFVISNPPELVTCTTP